MALITHDIPNLIGGVSQQPDAIRLPNQCEAQFNAISSPVRGLHKRPPTQLLGSSRLIENVQADTFIHSVNRDSDEQYFIALQGDGSVKVFDLAGASQTVTLDTADTNLATYFTKQGSDPAPKDLFRAVTIADVTFIANTKKTVAMADTLSASSLQANERLVHVKAAPGNFNSCKIEIKLNGTDLGFSNGKRITASDLLDSQQSNPQQAYLGAVPANEFGSKHDATAVRDGDFDSDNNIFAGREKLKISTDTQETTEQIRAFLDGKTFDVITDGETVTHSLSVNAASKTNVVHVFCTTSDFNLTISDGQSNNVVAVIKDSVEKFSQLPNESPHGIILEVEGNPEAEIDDYYVKFEADGGDPGNDIPTKGRWQETTKPGIKNDFNFDTMPHIIVRAADGTFKVTRADGSFGATPASPFTNFKFSPRQVGDTLTNPNPTFVDNTIDDLSFFRNRLVMLSGENVILSETAEYFNYFRTTVTQITDAEVIDLAVGGTTVAKLKHAIPFSDRLVLFANQAQFSLQSQGVLSPLTATITSQTQFEINSKVKPVVAGSSLFFAFPRGSNNGVKQYFKVNEVDIQFDAVDVTAQVPNYITGTIKDFASSTHEDILVTTSEQDPTTACVYKYLSSGTERVLSSWSKFTFGGEIFSMFFVDTELYLVMKYGSDLFLEKIEMQTGSVDVNSTYTTTLDRRTTINATGTSAVGEGSYNPSDNRTTYILNANYTPSADAQAVTAEGLVLTVTDRSAGQMKVSGDHTGSSTAPVYVGEPYTMTYEFSKPILKTPNRFGQQTPQVSIAGYRHQIRYMTVVFDQTSFFKIRVTPEYGTATEYPFSGRYYSDGSSVTDTLPNVDGDFRVPIFAQSDRVKVELVNDGALPSAFQAALFEADVTSRSRRT